MRFMNVDPKAVLKITALAAILALSAIACSNQTTPASSDSTATESTDSDTDDLSISPSTTTIAPETSVTLTASGGVSPYTYSIASGSGSVTSAGVFTAPSSDGYSIVMVYDSEGNYAYSSISIVTTTSTSTSTDTSTSTSTSGQINVYRLYNNVEHFYSADSTEGTTVGYYYEQLAFKVLASQVSGTHALYRCVMSGIWHFISLDSACEGQTLEGLYGYVYDSNVSGTSPLHRFYSNGDHLVTTTYSEGTDNGYTFEATLGYVPN